MMHALQQMPLTEWSGPPMLLIRPRVSQHGWFSFERASEMIDAGYAAAMTAFDQMGDALHRVGGVYPRRMVELSVDRERCIGCTTCVALAPRLMAMDASGKAYPTSSPVEWSPADGDFVQHCPTSAIEVRSVGATAASEPPFAARTHVPSGVGEGRSADRSEARDGDEPTADAAD
jgi:NTE family protein